MTFSENLPSPFSHYFPFKYLQPLRTRDVLLFSIMIVELMNDTQGKQNQSSSIYALCCLYKGPPQTHYSANKGALYIIYNYIYFLSNHLPSKGSPILT